MSLSPTVLMQTAKVDPATQDNDDDDGIVREVVAGSVARFEVLMRRYNQRIYRIVRPLCSNDADAEDVAQDAWISAYRYLHQWDGRASFSTWVARIAVNAALRHKSRAMRRPVTLLEDSDAESAAAPVPADPERGVAQGELGQLIEQAISNLPETLRLVFVMRELEELSGSDTAEILGLTPEAVRVRLHRARHALRSHIEDAVANRVHDAFAFAGARCDRIVIRVLDRLTGPA